MAPLIHQNFEEETCASELPRSRASEPGHLRCLTSRNSSADLLQPLTGTAGAAGEDETQDWSEVCEGPASEAPETSEYATEAFLGEPRSLWSCIWGCICMSAAPATPEARGGREEILEFLQQQNMCLGSNGHRLVLGRKFAEGGQAHIYHGEWVDSSGKRLVPTAALSRRVIKVFKHPLSLRRLRRVCSFQNLRVGHQGEFTTMCYGATLLPDGRFAFVFDCYWGSLHELIARRMELRPGAPPFEPIDEVRIMLEIARGMRALHAHGILHRDLKPSNILIGAIAKSDPVKDASPLMSCNISDFESNEGVLGTRFFRAPEILAEVRKSKELGSKVVDPGHWTEKVDVYAFGMTCFEIVSGKTAFQDCLAQDYDMVLVREERPVLPDHVKDWIQALLAKCWHADPSQRPSFFEIENDLLWTNRT